MKTQLCEAASCRKPFTYARRQSTGKTIPLDVDVAACARLAEKGIKPQSYRVWMEGDLQMCEREDDPAKGPLFVSHYQTCKEPQTFRKRKKGES